jgi:hypothetical protein
MILSPFRHLKEGRHRSQFEWGARKRLRPQPQEPVFIELEQLNRDKSERSRIEDE